MGLAVVDVGSANTLFNVGPAAVLQLSNALGTGAPLMGKAVVRTARPACGIVQRAHNVGCMPLIYCTTPFAV